MAAALTFLPVFALFVVIGLFCYSSAKETKPVSRLLRFVGGGLLFVGGSVFLPGLLIFLGNVAEPQRYVGGAQLLSVWLLIGALLLGTGLLINVGRFSLRVLLCLVLLAAALSSLPVMLWAE